MRWFKKLAWRFGYVRLGYRNFGWRAAWHFSGEWVNGDWSIYDDVASDLTPYEAWYEDVTA